MDRARQSCKMHGFDSQGVLIQEQKCKIMYSNKCLCNTHQPLIETGVLFVIEKENRNRKSLLLKAQRGISRIWLDHLPHIVVLVLLLCSTFIFSDQP